MNIQIMLLPHKHVRFGSSLIAIAGYVRELIQEPKTVDEIWSIINSEHNEPFARIKPTFTQLILAIDILFAIKQANCHSDGRILLFNSSAKPESMDKLNSDDKES